MRKLRVTCARADDAQHSRVVLEDALRTATFGDEGRLVIVRRLDLGRIARSASATHWSRRLEQSYQKTRPVPVRFDSPAAAQAAAVVFANRYEPWLVLATRTAARRSCTEWFWRTALPGWSAHLAPAHTLRLCFRMLARQGGLPLTVLLAQRLSWQRDLPALLHALEPDDLAEIGPDLPAPPATSLPDSTVTPAAVSLPPEIASATVTRWSDADVRARWLAHVQMTLAVGARQTGRALVPTTPAVIQQVLLGWTELDEVPLVPSPLALPAPAVTASDPTPAAPEFALATWLPDRIFTRGGGLFFLLPLLLRGGFPAFLATLPASERHAAPWQFLRLVLRHCRIAPDDPLCVSLQALPSSPRPLGPWLLRTARDARGLAGLTLRQIVCRPALAALSPTHLDLFFRPGDADIRIRRSGLDIDPGWVPWLGRVVAYHFTREDGT